METAPAAVGLVEEAETARAPWAVAWVPQAEKKATPPRQLRGRRPRGGASDFTRKFCLWEDSPGCVNRATITSCEAGTVRIHPSIKCNRNPPSNDDRTCDV